MAKATEFADPKHLALSCNNKNSIARKPRGDNATVMARNNPISWGLKIPGRPPTPSEGYAQQYDRIGPAETQKLWTFDNGTCLRYGPDDLVDEFDPDLHPFSNQIALIDTMIRDIVAVRTRYEGSERPQQDDSHSDKTAIDEDPFNNFRQRNVDYSTLPRISLASGYYTQIPSRFASIGNMVSVYTVPNRSDIPGECHRGISNDTRFGMSGKPSYGAQQLRDQKNVQRQDNIHRSAMQRLMQNAGQNGGGRGRRGRSGRHLGLQSRRTYDQTYQLPIDARNYRNPSRGVGRGEGQQKRGRGVSGRGGKRNDSFHAHQRFKSQAFSVADTPLSSFVFPSVNDKYALEDYEDEGPLPGTPQTQKWVSNYFDEDADEDTLSGKDQLSQLNLVEEDLAPLRCVKGNIARQGFLEKLAMSVEDRSAVSRTLRGSHQTISSHGNSYSVPQGKNADLVFNPGAQGFPPSIPSFRALGNIRFDAGDNEEDSTGIRLNRILGAANEMSRVNGDISLDVGDHHVLLNDKPLSVPHHAADPVALMQFERRMAQLEFKYNSTAGRDESRADMEGLIRSDRARSHLIASGSSTRPSSPFMNEERRSSEPPRNRPASLFLLTSRDTSSETFEGAYTKIFGEEPGAVSASTEQSPDEIRKGRRLFE